VPVVDRHYGPPITGTSGVARAVLVVAAALALLGATASAGAARTSVTEIEGEVMCPICGTLLELAESPQAKRERAYIAKLAAAGKSEAEIKDALVTQYGPEVLALPKGSGFDLTAYLVPLIAIFLAIALLGFSLLRWRREGGRSDRPPRRLPPEGAEAERLEADLSRYDL
jgi:cytochrome c-type biogenesis protein CcmH/NrfF